MIPSRNPQQICRFIRTSWLGVAIGVAFLAWKPTKEQVHDAIEDEADRLVEYLEGRDLPVLLGLSVLSMVLCGTLESLEPEVRQRWGGYILDLVTEAAENGG